MDKLVSIVIPVYGVEKFIDQCARSLFEQTYDNIQYIFVNDCTKDNSVISLKEIIELYPDRKSQVLIIEKEKNEGLPLARKTGMQYVKGEYVMLLDSDDWVETTMVEQMLNAIVAENTDVVYCDYYRNSDTQTPINCIELSNTKEYIKNMFLLRAPAQTWNKIYRTELFDDVEFPLKSMHEDLYINIQVMSYAKSVSHLRKNFYHYRNNPNSITHNYPLEQTIENLRLMRYFLEEKNMKDVLPCFYSFLNYVKSFAFKRIRPLDKSIMQQLFMIDKESDKYIFQRQQFNSFPTQLYLFVKMLMVKVGIW
jgi:glycosyltransferase involved in cell wall biosynthesis